MIDATPLLRLYAAYRHHRLGAQDPVAEQERLLLRLVRHATQTRFGLDHSFAGIRSVADFQDRVALSRYEDLWENYWKPEFPKLTNCTWPGTIPYFAVTSGTTTGITKYIPCSQDILDKNRNATLDICVHHLRHHPQSEMFGGRNFMLGGSTRLTELAPGIWSGDLSGIAGKTAPAWSRPFYFPPRALETIEDWEEKITRMAPASLEADIRSIGGTPSWLLLFFDKLASLRPEAPRDLSAFYPNLELVVHGGVNFAPYRSIFRGWLDNCDAKTREVYPASEGFIAVADRGDGEGLRLIVDQGLFFEFVPVEDLNGANPRRHWLANAEIGVNYALVLSTCAGLWSYIIGDTVRLIERDPPRILITGRTSYSLSAFGEHLIGEEIENAISAAAAYSGTGVKDYCVGAVFPERDGDVGGHLYVVEFDGEPLQGERLEGFIHKVDERLAEDNEDYKVHRSGGYGMSAPTVLAVGSGTFAQWMKSRGKLGGQNKVPRIINDQALLTNLRDFVRDRRNDP